MNDDRLSQIETLWSIVRQAHSPDDVDSSEECRLAQEALLQRYGGPIRRYLLGALRDESAADEVYQEFAVRFVSGHYRQASPDKGKFRSFLKTVLFRLVADHYRKRSRNRSMPMEQAVNEPEAADDRETREAQFAEVWRDEMLKKTWELLAAFQEKTDKPYYSIMRLRVQHPELRSAELAAALSSELQRPISSANVRVLLHRAREEFADRMIDVISESLNTRSYDDVEEELAELRLLKYCHVALQKRKGETE